MLNEILPFRLELDATALAGISLWSLSLYLGFSPISDRVMLQIERWLSSAERFLYSPAQFDRTRVSRQNQIAFYASLLSIVPFLVAGSLLNWGVELGLGRSWALSLGILACMGSGVYELGRRDGQASREK